MTTQRIAVLGASGFVGTELVETLWRRPGVEVVPVIHSAGSAWRIARHGRPLYQVDLADAGRLREVVDGCTHVVNCTRGGRDVMIDGFGRILQACMANGGARLVHLSSVMVYGDPPHPQSEHESAPTPHFTDPDSYGALKQQQDAMVRAAVQRGLKAVVLCPPNIGGPFSDYLAGIVQSLRRGGFAMLDEGRSVCSLVDVRNLCHAIERALVCDDRAANGERLFVTDPGEFSWGDLVAELAPLAGHPMVPSIDRETLLRLTRPAEGGPKPSWSRSLKHLVSSDVRAALRRDPKLARVDRALRSAVARLGPNLEGKVRRGIEGVTKIERPDPHAGLALGLVAQQLRGVRHRSGAAAASIQYAPPWTFAASMASFRAWYRAMHGMDTQTWAIARYLYPGER